MKNKAESFLSISFVITVVINSFSFLSFNMGTAAFPVYASTLGYNHLYIGLITTVTAIASLLVRPVLGFIIDRISIIKVTILGLLLMSLPCFGMVMNKSIAIFLIMRSLQGAGWGVTSTACSKLIANCLSKKYLSSGIGCAGFFSSLATALAPSLAILVFRNFGSILLISLITLSTLLMVPLTIYLNKKIIIKSIAPTTKDKFVINKEIIISSVLIATITFAYSPIITFITRFSSSFGVNDLTSFFLTYAIATMLIRPIMGYYVDTKGYIFPTVLSLISMILCLTCLFICKDSFMLIPVAVLAGISTGSGMNTLQTKVVNSVNGFNRGKALTIFLSGFDFGMAFGALLFGIFVDIAGFSFLYLVYSVFPITGLVIYLCYIKYSHS